MPALAASAPGAASGWVARYISGVRAGGTVLDVACGRGRHLRLALELGLAAVGIDRDLSGVRDLEGRDKAVLIQADLEDGSPLPFAGRCFDGVIVTNYLWRPVLGAIVAAVGPAGVLIYETFGEGNGRFGKPSNPDFLLRPGELIEAVRPDLTVIAYEHVTLTTPARIVQRVVAVGPLHPWLSLPPGP